MDYSRFMAPCERSCEPIASTGPFGSPLLVTKSKLEERPKMEEPRRRLTITVSWSLRELVHGVLKPW